jgi:hypothetical protein
MSIVKIPEERKEQFTLELHPEIVYLSSSIEIPKHGIKIGVTGSAPLRRRPSKCIKELEPLEDPQMQGVAGSSTSTFDESKKKKSVNLKRAQDEAARANVEGFSANVYSWLNQYMTEVNLSPQPAANTKKIFITRFDPPFTHDDISVEKSIIKNNLMTFYESTFDLCEMSYTNYHTLNFFSAPNTSGAPAVGNVKRIPDNSAIIYQNISKKAGKPRPYSPSGSFSFDFYINPRYTNEKGSSFTAGTIMHLSSTFALSLISGSSVGEDGTANSFRLMLQLSHSADIPPSEVDVDSIGTYPRDLIFLSKDNTLNRNKWSHCTVRWGTSNFNEGTGSFVIESSSSNFVVPSSSIMPPKHISNSALIVGNYFEGKDNEAKFFNKSTTSEGVSPVLDFGSGLNVDPTYTMRHPLNAEVHELKIYKKYISNREILSVKKSSPRNLKDLMFYVPPLFVPEVEQRNMLITPFQAPLTSSTKPFNEIYSFGVGGFVMNLENHVVDLITKNKPRCFHLTASTIDNTVQDITANQHAYSTGSIKKRNLTILPNDNGKFKPDYSVASSLLNLNTQSTRKKNGGKDLSIISLENMISRDTIFPGVPTTTSKNLRRVIKNQASTFADDTSSGAIANVIAGVTPESLTGNAGPILTIAQRTRDRTSNEICFFDISNLYYGNQIQDKTLYISDPILTGSDGKIKITIADNGKGGMYRADSEGPHPVWSNIGNVLYHEGVAIIKAPALSYFGKDCFELKARGYQNTHISIFNVPLAAGAFNSSSNPNYQILSASAAASDEGKRFIYIDSLNIHDENFNVIARSNFAQPVKKRIDDSLLIRFKMDF